MSDSGDITCDFTYNSVHDDIFGDRCRRKAQQFLIDITSPNKLAHVRCELHLINLRGFKHISEEEAQIMLVLIT